MNNVLVFTPVYRLEPETVRSVFALEWAGAISFLLQRDNPTGNPYLDHLHQYQRGREMFLRGDYDSLLIIESDVIVPRDGLKRLAALDVDMAYGCYVYRDSFVVNILERYAAWPEQPRNPGESLSIREQWDKTVAKGLIHHLLGASKYSGTIDCSGSGLGCVLIKRHVIEAVPFDDEMTMNGTQFCDFPWTCRVYDQFHMQADLDVQCGHVDKDGTELWLARG